MWFLIITIIIVAILILAMKSKNKEAIKYHTERGGLRKSYTNFTTHLEKYYNMEFVTDTGKSFSYSKQIKDTNGNFGTLFIGIELDISNATFIFSKFVNKYNGEYLGLNVTANRLDNIETIDKYINMSIEEIKSKGVIDYANTKNLLINTNTSISFIAEWEKLKEKWVPYDKSMTLEVFIEYFFINDLIDIENFVGNYDILRNPYKRGSAEFGTESIHKIYYVPPKFNLFFIAAYPDVFLWFQEDMSKEPIEATKNITNLTPEELSEYFSDLSNFKSFYRNLVVQYIKEGNKLECVKENERESKLDTPIQIKFLESASDFIEYLSDDSKNTINECINNSLIYIRNNFKDHPHGVLFEYKTPIEDGLEYSYFAFWDRRLNKDIVVIASHGFGKIGDKIPNHKIEMINNLKDNYLKMDV